MKVASQINYPIYLETDTELQDRILEICDVYELKKDKKYLKENIRQCIFDYYNEDMLNVILDSWMEQDWISSERRAALKEAIEVYGEGRYYSAGSILMCQIGGIITELYDVTNTINTLSYEERKATLNLYHIRKMDSEKSKILQMMSMQSNGIFQWHKSAEYFMNYTYSSSPDMDVFEHDPGRNKICHGKQTNYGTHEHALKAILAVDIAIQLGMQMLSV